jgi:hypothetical protein
MASPGSLTPAADFRWRRTVTANTESDSMSVGFPTICASVLAAREKVLATALHYDDAGDDAHAV